MLNLPIYLAMTGFAVMGIGAMVLPMRVTAQFDIPNLTVSGKNEIRAVYGGFGLAMVMVLLIAIEQPALRAGILLAVAASLGGMATGRVISAFVDRTIGKWPLFYLLLEIIFSSLLVAAI